MMSETEDAEILEQEIKLWLQNKGLSYASYLKLPKNYQNMLYNSVCTPNQLISDRQRRELYRLLCKAESVVAGREAINPVDAMKDENLRDFFSPLTTIEKITYFDKF